MQIPAESVLQRECKLVRSGQISQCHIFAPSKCRPLHSAARGACLLRSPPSRRHGLNTKAKTKTAQKWSGGAPRPRSRCKNYNTGCNRNANQPTQWIATAKVQ